MRERRAAEVLVAEVIIFLRALTEVALGGELAQEATMLGSRKTRSLAGGLRGRTSRLCRGLHELATMGRAPFLSPDCGPDASRPQAAAPCYNGVVTDVREGAAG